MRGTPSFFSIRQNQWNLPKSHCADPFRRELCLLLLWWNSVSVTVPASTQGTAGHGALRLIPLLYFDRDKGRLSHFLNARTKRADMSSQGCSEQHISCIPFTPSYSVSEEMSSDAIVKHTKDNAVISSSSRANHTWATSLHPTQHWKTEDSECYMLRFCWDTLPACCVVLSQPNGWAVARVQ